MGRILLTWELGLNLGHLTRLLRVAQQLKKDGHTVFVAARDLQAATAVLGPAGIPFVQAPYLPTGVALAHRPASYADILLSQGWSDRRALWGLIQAWINLLQMSEPHRLVLDYSPTASLAARIAKIPTTLVGNGFELPPLTTPLPAFPGFSWATAERAHQSESIAVANANSVLGAYRAPPIEALRDLFAGGPVLLATVPELDHYGARQDARYIGPLLGKLSAPRVDWPKGEGPRIFACVRPDTRHAAALLKALSGMSDARIICVAPSFKASQLHPLRKEHIRFALGPVELQPLLDSDLCISYGAEGTMLSFLMAGVPQLISPWHVETYMAARRIQNAGMGEALADQTDEAQIVETIWRLTGDNEMRDRTRAFATRAFATRAAGWLSDPNQLYGDLAA
jgi:UDP:flavonoid glycosyltransferase YjiC (YdhE family)